MLLICLHSFAAHIRITTKKTADNTKVFDRKHACILRGVECKIARHLMMRPKDKVDVVSALRYTKNSVEQKKAVTKLCLQGDYHHNINTLETVKANLSSSDSQGRMRRIAAFTTSL